jgi:hypothetical protein
VLRPALGHVGWSTYDANLRALQALSSQLMGWDPGGRRGRTTGRAQRHARALHDDIAGRADANPDGDRTRGIDPLPQKSPTRIDGPPLIRPTAAAQRRYSGGTWLLTWVPWYRWSWSLQAAGKKNWTLSLRTPL